MITKKQLPILLWFILLVVSIPLLRFAMHVRESAPLPERWQLPYSIGEWQGETLYYSTNPEVTTSFTSKDIVEAGICPVSAAPLDTISPLERRLLPRDVTILRKLYRGPDNRERLVIGLITGESREGIHRPEWCLAAQGFRVGRREVINVEPQAHAPFKAGVYPLVPANVSDGFTPSRYFIYWFESPDGYKTPYNGIRILRSGYARLLQGSAQRWAYFSIQLNVPPGTENIDAYLAETIKWLIE